MSRTESTIMGPETEDEMCWNILSYWPLQPNLRCASGHAAPGTIQSTLDVDGGVNSTVTSEGGVLGAMWAGSLRAAEDVRNIALTHPASNVIYRNATYVKIKMNSIYMMFPTLEHWTPMFLMLVCVLYVVLMEVNVSPLSCWYVFYMLS
jgi:hypothetical protein